MGAMDFLRCYDQKVYSSMLAFHKKECALVERLRLVLIEKVIRSTSPAETLTIALAHFLSVAIVFRAKTLAARASCHMPLAVSECAELVRISRDESCSQIFLSCQCVAPVAPVYGMHTQ